MQDELETTIYIERCSDIAPAENQIERNGQVNGLQGCILNLKP